MRKLFFCNDLGLSSYTGNQLILSGTARKGINRVQFMIADNLGDAFPMQMGQYGAYTLNYHHRGAARHYLIVKPSEFDKVEAHVLHLTKKDTQAEKTLRCSQFVAHQKIMITSEDLIFQDIGHFKVTQHPGELVIIFPWAYYQGRSDGPNISEQMLYASKRWEVFHREGLYVPCSRQCSAGDDDTFDMSFMNGTPATSPAASLSSSYQRRRRLKRGFATSRADSNERGSTGHSEAAAAEDGVSKAILKRADHIFRQSGQRAPRSGHETYKDRDEDRPPPPKRKRQD